MSDFPERWACVRLQDVCELINGRAYKQDELLERGKYPVLRVGNFFSNRNWYYSNLDLDSEKYCDSGDLLYAWSASFGPRIWDGGKVIFHYHIWKTRLVDVLIEKRFLYHWFEWDKENIKSDHGTGSTMIHVTKGDMEARKFALPSLSEQRRIVAKIDSLTGKSRRARDHLDHIPRLVEKYKQAVLNLAFSHLTERTRLLDLVERERGIPYGIVQTGTPYEGGIPTVRCGDVKDFCVGLDQLKLVDPKIELGHQRTRLKGGEVLITIRGSVGETCVVPLQLAGCNISREVAMIPPKPEISSEFVMYFLATSEAKRFILGNTKGVAQQGINLRDLKELPTPNCSLDEQIVVAERIQAAFTWIDRLTADTTSARKLIDHLDQSVLAKAFKGELVPQDPTDEPASALLERIRAERAAAPKAKRGRRKVA
ncbi:hypothetical protein FOH24_02605 [Acetobacter tropicalis]|uniref:Type I restriction-modification system, specificity subunit S n=1 Tax=Acetobacter tropicalis TaxID=104102 RepID=A0A094YHR6_9PROT|nr:restriction endonuclease subunit S [Acetobacter tropicalis]KAA8391014.1 hypothetical protein FOH22_01350 [Acetobacter tropicalis]KAA8392552.1 hypothetical protein FOH24_02605 [Acetobacter tropicalis]KGB21575.1 Type I restriction-modification system, specificity subunit S [Acetobacter tropicalis]MBC9009145.1 restriction endonuclease subunit S [Acetobacter tropicalis]MDO8171821.1 restriction endonuclease subunit S [Acetobacter tropicalis]